MKILHINTEKTWRGGEQQTLYLASALKARGISCHLVCQPESPMAQKAGDADLAVFPVFMRGEADPMACYRIRNLIKTYNYDILHSHTSHAHTLAFLASIGCKVCRLVTRRVDFSIFRHSFLGLSGIKYKHMADYYIAISRKIKDVMAADGVAAQRIAVVHSGVDLKRFVNVSGDHLIEEFNLIPDEKVVINVAHLAGHKGQQFLVRAIPLVLEKIPGVRFFIVGKGELLAELQELGYNIVIYPVTTLRLAMKAVEEGLASILEKGSQKDLLDKMQHRKRLYEILHYKDYNQFDDDILFPGCAANCEFQLLVWFMIANVVYEVFDFVADLFSICFDNYVVAFYRSIVGGAVGENVGYHQAGIF